MILLESYNRIIHDTLSGRFKVDPSAEEVSDNIYVNLADFDGVTYRLSNPVKPSTLVLSMNLACFPELAQYGAFDVLKSIYGDMLQSTPEPGFHVTLHVDMESAAFMGGDKESMLKNVSLLKCHSLAAPFQVAFDAQANGQTTNIMPIHYREEECIYVQAQKDRVTVIFSTVFKEEADQIFGRVFLQEFVDARRQPAIQNAPQVLYSPKEPPMELRGVPGIIPRENIGYVTFVLFPRHYMGAAAFGCISRIQLFRDYLHYHIKASKAYMHSRMRARVDSFLKVLNRAKPEPQDKEKKTISGKTFRSK